MRRKKRAQEEFGKEALAEGGSPADAPAAAAPAPDPAATPTGPAGEPPGPAIPPTGHITPVDIQQKMFKRVMKGYSETEVDAFLDEVTEGLARLLAEHKRLREQVELLGMRATTTLDASSAADADALVRGARDEAARILAEARQQADAALAGSAARAPSAPAEDARWFADLTKTFVSREREFLQGLASMIQQHAEAVREDLRRTQQVPPPAPTAEPEPDGASAEPPVEAEREPEEASAQADEPEVPAVVTEAAPAAQDPHRPWRPEPTRSMTVEELRAGPVGSGPPTEPPAGERAAGGGETEAEWWESDRSRAAAPPTKAPARSETPRGDPAEGDDEKDSLRELFWGED